MACAKLRSVSGNGGLQVSSTYYRCNYINRAQKLLTITDSDQDTSSLFSLARNSVSQFTTNSELMVVTYKSEKYLVDKNFRQITFKGHHNIYPGPATHLLICEKKGNFETVYTGVIDLREKIVVPYNYSSISISAPDSLIIACSAGLAGKTDDIYDYSGRKIYSSSRHIQQAGRRYVVQKSFEPKVRYHLLGRNNSVEHLTAEEILLAANEQVIFRKNSRWFLFDPETGEKKPIKSEELYEKNKSSH